jgi:hypothetical protein
MQVSVFLSTFAIVATASSVALADDLVFGKSGQLAISSDANLSFTSTSETGGGESNTVLLLEPAADYFVIDGLSVGGFVLLEHESIGQGETTWGIGPRVGYNLAITDKFSFWPKLGFSYTSTSVTLATNGMGGTSSGTESAFALTIFAPFLFHPAPHFFVGLGPIFSTQLSNSESAGGVSVDGAKATTFGLAFTIGGWVGL